MAVIRQQNWLGQQRADVPHLRSVESAICADFDLLAGRILAGKQALVISGFTLNHRGAIHVSQLQLRVASAQIVHYFASESGSVFAIPDDRADEALTAANPRVVGQFAPLQTNFIGVDLVRTADNSTADLAMFMDKTTLLETPKEVPLARTLDYRIIISTIDFSTTPGVCPIARVSTDVDNNITEVQDARNLFFRLGTGGTAPNRLASYSWPSGRKEFTDPGDDLFSGGDRSIDSLKSWCNAVMTRIWENSGGEYWYSPTSERNVRMVHSGSPFVSTGEYFEWSGSNLHWQGLRVVFDNSTGYYNEVENQTANLVNLTDLASGECIYVDLDRTQDRTGGAQLKAKKGVLKTLGTGTPPGSRIVLAWRHGTEVFTRDQGYSVNSSFHLATTAAVGTVRLSMTDVAAGGSGTRTTSILAGPDTHWQAIAGGLTRGETSNDFVGGTGSLYIGGGSRDRSIFLYTTQGGDSVEVGGTQTGTTPSLKVANLGTFSNDRQLVQMIGRSQGGFLQTAVTIDTTGAVGLRNTEIAPSTPSGLVRSKMFFRTNGALPGQMTPVCRDQFCVMWFDGSVTVLAQSPLY